MKSLRGKINPPHKVAAIDPPIGGIATLCARDKESQDVICEAREFAQSTMDALSSHICVLNELGVIISVAIICLGEQEGGRCLSSSVRHRRQLP